MKTSSSFATIIALLGIVASPYAGGAQDEGYPAATLTPSVDLGLQPIEVQVPQQLADLVPVGLSLNVPEGFTVGLFAAGLRGPRFMAFDEDEVLHVANMNADQIVALPDRNRDGVADEHIVASSGFKEAHSLAFYRGVMYVADTDAIFKFRDEDGDLVYEDREVLTDLTSPGACCSNGWHTTRTIVIDEADQKIYVGIGSPCDLCRSSAPTKAGGTDPLPPSEEWGSILEMNIDGSEKRVFATGVRNTVGLTLHPITGELWGNNNGHDKQGRSSPPEWIDVIREGDFMGHPFVNSHQVWNDFTVDRYRRLLPITPEDSLLAARQKKPVALVPAHYAPMALHFYTARQFPERYRNVAFVAFRAGKALNSSHPGYNVSALFAEPDGSDAQIGEFVTGFQTGTTQSSLWGRPVGLTTDREGSLYVGSDSRTEVILKMTYSAVGGSWEHNLPDVLAAGVTSLSVQATVQVVRTDADGGEPRLTADLSQLGGPADVPLEADGDTYRLDTRLDLQGVPAGPRVLRILIEQDGADKVHRSQLAKLITLLPSDRYILDDRLALDWTITGEKGAQPIAASGPVFHGAAAQSVAAVAESFSKLWALELRPEAPVEVFGMAGIRLAFHPGDLTPLSISRLSLFVNGRAVNLLRDFEVDIEKREWQIVEVPWASFRFRDEIKTVESIRLEGNPSGTFFVDDVRLVTTIPASDPVATAVVESREGTTPSAVLLQQNYPNPFNSATTISYELPRRATVALDVYNLAGQEVAGLVYGLRQAGTYSLTWDGRDNADRELASGVYIYRLQVGENVQTRRLLLLR
ncbi:MAG: PQQ-dependent sugar dehydrogenase [Candidatus Latescibacteria bacterium]|jgi:glucose/arabinose dehydrogenase|nr:PQQ-dependent sugar dehydrogenase [Candidatus Latescibacterota bacterium]